MAPVKLSDHHIFLFNPYKNPFFPNPIFLWHICLLVQRNEPQGDPKYLLMFKEITNWLDQMEKGELKHELRYAEKKRMWLSQPRSYQNVIFSTFVSLVWE